MAHITEPSPSRRIDTVRATDELAEMATQHTPEQLLALLQASIREAPILYFDSSLTDDDQRWLGRVVAILEGSGNVLPAATFRIERDRIGYMAFDRAKLMQPLYDVLSDLELRVPASLQGAFIPPGDNWNGYASLVKLVQTDCDSLLIIDPFVSADIFTDFMPHAVARNGTRILTAKQSKLHEALFASSQKWLATHPDPATSVEVRYAPATALHDRLIIADGTAVWLVSQSMKDIAKKSAASVTRADPELAEMKAKHYGSLWGNSDPIS